jgi:hypothetical protein
VCDSFDMYYIMLFTHYDDSICHKYRGTVAWNQIIMWCEVLRLPVNMKSTVLYYMTPCTLVDSYWTVRRHILQDGDIQVVLIHNFFIFLFCMFRREKIIFMMSVCLLVRK